MKRSLRRFLLILAALLIYLLLFPEPTHRELTVQAQWGVAPLELAATETTGEGDLIPFEFQSEFGYLSAAGTLAYRGSSAYQVSLGSRQFVSYDQRPRSLVVQDSRGDFLFTVDTPGYPLVNDGQILVIAPDGVTLSSVLPDGQWQWQQTLPSNITALRARGGLTVAGVLGGSVHAIDSQGRALLVDAASVDTSGVVQNVAVSSDGRAFATTSSPEFLLAAESVAEMSLALYQVSEERAVPVLRRRYLRNARALPAIYLAESDPLLIYTTQRPRERAEGVSRTFVEETIIANLETGTEVRVQTVNPVGAIEEQAGHGLYWLLARSTQPDPGRGFRYANELASVDASGVRPISLEMAADVADLQIVGDLLIAQVDDRLLAFSIEER
ncbi:MAG: hypothetical protein ACLFNT_06195 [Spirochaetales bacterium]